MLAGETIYKTIESWLEPSWPLQVVLALFILGITGYLLWRRNPVVLAAWLTYLYMP